MSTAERAEMVCPLNGKLCVNGVREDFPSDKVGNKAKCRMWTGVVGMNPQTGKQVDDFDCAVAWMPVLMIEASNMMRQTTASVDKAANIVYGALPGPVQKRVVDQMPSLRPQMGAPQLPGGLNGANGKPQ